MSESLSLEPDLAGLNYVEVLRHLHLILCPKTYFEIGTLYGNTLSLARCSSLAVDPKFQLNDITLLEQIVSKPKMLFFQTTSDLFFAEQDPTALLGGPIDLAFLDGMHRCEFLLRDFMNAERHGRQNSLFILHDCLPVEVFIAERMPNAGVAEAPHRQGWWTGDVWRTALLLKRFRPDLSITAIDAHPTGLLLVTNLDPGSTTLAENYAEYVRTMMSWSLQTMGIRSYFAEMEVEPVANLDSHEQVTARFWL